MLAHESLNKGEYSQRKGKQRAKNRRLSEPPVNNALISVANLSGRSEGVIQYLRRLPLVMSLKKRTVSDARIKVRSYW
jgi:hypothetical protein